MDSSLLLPLLPSLLSYSISGAGLSQWLGSGGWCAERVQPDRCACVSLAGL